MDQLSLISEITSKKFSGRNSIKERLAWVFSYNAISDIMYRCKNINVDLFIFIQVVPYVCYFLAFKTLSTSLNFLLACNFRFKFFQFHF